MQGTICLRDAVSGFETPGPGHCMQGPWRQPCEGPVSQQTAAGQGSCTSWCCGWDHRADVRILLLLSETHPRVLL